MVQKVHEPKRQWENQREDILLAIDQLSQITEVMGQVLSREKQQVDTLEKSHDSISITHNKQHNTTMKKPAGHYHQKNKTIDILH